MKSTGMYLLFLLFFVIKKRDKAWKKGKVMMRWKVKVWVILITKKAAGTIWDAFMTRDIPKLAYMTEYTQEKKQALQNFLSRFRCQIKWSDWGHISLRRKKQYPVKLAVHLRENITSEFSLLSCSLLFHLSCKEGQKHYIQRVKNEGVWDSVWARLSWR